MGPRWGLSQRSHLQFCPSGVHLSSVYCQLLLAIRNKEGTHSIDGRTKSSGMYPGRKSGWVFEKPLHLRRIGVGQYHPRYLLFLRCTR